MKEAVVFKSPVKCIFVNVFVDSKWTTVVLYFTKDVTSRYVVPFHSCL